MSTSSAVTLDFHTEAAFHPLMPRYLALLCLRGDPNAGTTLCSIEALLPHLDPRDEALLRQPLYTTGIDESYTHIRSSARSKPRAILTGTATQPRLWFDNDLMLGVTTEAQDALNRLGELVREHASTVYLCTGDLLVVDNTAAVHGRTPFQPRFDGTDRWLQRSLVVLDHRDAGEDLDGRIVTTAFAAA